MKLSLLQSQQHLPVPGDAQVGGQAGQAIRKGETGGKAGGIRRRRGAPGAGIVHLIHMALGGEQAVGQGAVVGEEQEPLGVLIQAAHR